MENQEQVWETPIVKKQSTNIFCKTIEEKIALANAKKRHKEFVKNNPNYTGIK